MRHWLVLAAVYAVVAALVLPGSLLASDDSPAPAAEPARHGDPGVARGRRGRGRDDGRRSGHRGRNGEPSPRRHPRPSRLPPRPAPESAPDTPAPAEPAPAEPAPADEVLVEPEADDEPSEKNKKAKASKRVKAKAADTANVTIKDFDFTPATVTVVVGDTVTWTNDGPSAHSATAENGSFDTGIFPAGESRSATFDEAGTFAYICTPHPNMEGTVVVEAAGSDRAGEEEAGGARERRGHARRGRRDGRRGGLSAKYGQGHPRDDHPRPADDRHRQCAFPAGTPADLTGLPR